MKKILLISLVSFLTVNVLAQTAPIKVYPNPAVVNITFEPIKYIGEGSSLTVFNFLGKKVADIKNFSTRTTLPVADFARGVYIYIIYDKTGKQVIANGKFQVSK